MGIRPSGIREQTRRTPWATQDLMTTITWNFAIAWVYLDAIGWMVKQPTSADLHKNSIGLVIQHIVRANGWEATRLDKVLKYSVSGPSGRFSKSTFPLLKMKTHGIERTRITTKETSGFFCSGFRNRCEDMANGSGDLLTAKKKVS
ncbi:hypothetical protein RvY_07756-2 [Ramazzottius varieornatus]|uniref:Uncharacterized protein n=1 Tax=Ramazzottius varieornatus TaxID=947166 RepID=A0A1D1V5Z2_RAMVA|nr:hypothetical protein RvY_07756-2 [Ramazzottius varieornatus]